MADLPDTKLIPLTQGHFAIVDADWYEMLSQVKWTAVQNSRSPYAITKISSSGGGKPFYEQMHRVIMDAAPHMTVDHINFNGLDNRRCNLRLCTKGENSRARRKSLSLTSSKYKGLHWCKRGNRWDTRIVAAGKRIYIGYFKNEDDAARAYNEAALKYHGEFAILNVIESGC